MALTVIVTGVGGSTGTPIALHLANAGHNVHGLDARDVILPGVHSWQVPACDDRRYLGTVRSLAALVGADLVIPTLTEELVTMAEAATTFAPSRVVVGTEQAVALANDKLLAATRLIELGIATPDTMAYHGEPADFLVSRFGPRWIVKPRRGHGGHGVALGGPNDLSALPSDGSYLVQHYLPGLDYCVAGYVGSVTHTAGYLKLARARSPYGPASRICRCFRDDAERTCLDAVAAIGLTGPFDADIREGADHTLQVIEINPRFGPHSTVDPAVIDALVADSMLVRPRQQVPLH